jgi:hypothetical protein
MTHHRTEGDDGATVESRRPIPRTAGVAPAFSVRDARVPCQTSPSGIEAVFSDVCVCQKKTLWGSPRLISTGARKVSNSAPFERLQPGERGFRESTAFYLMPRRLRGVPCSSHLVVRAWPPMAPTHSRFTACRGRESATERRAAGFAAALAGQVLAIGCPSWYPSVGPGP